MKDLFTRSEDFMNYFLIVGTRPRFGFFQHCSTTTYVVAVRRLLIKKLDRFDASSDFS